MKGHSSTMSLDQSTSLYAPLSQSSRPLRIGILLDGPQINSWEMEVVDLLVKSGLGTLELIVINQEPFARNKVVVRKSFYSLHPNELFWQYTRLDKRLNADVVDIFQASNIDRWANETPTLNVFPMTRKFVHRIKKQDIEAIREHDVDVLIRFGFNILRGEILTAAKHGVWSYHHGDNTRFKGGPAFFWEIAERDPVSGTVLQRLSEKLDDGNVIFRSYGATANTMWHSQNQSEHYKKSISFVARCARQLIADGELSGAQPTRDLRKKKDRIYVQPTNSQMARFLTNTLIRKVWNKLFANRTGGDWKIAVRPLTGDNPDFALNLSSFTIIENPDNAWKADPFIFEHECNDFLFYEEFNNDAGRGHIRCARLGASGDLIDDQAVLEEDFHLSYPFVFRWENEVYMIPETFEKNEVRLYRCTQFPRKWTYEKTLLSGFEFVDATLHFHEGTWYLFVCTSESGGPLNDELFLFFSETPLGPWQPHKMNPIKSDVRSARPAGRPFVQDGNLLRPAQDCTGKYGRRLALCAIKTLSREVYEEELLFFYSPSSYRRLAGCHTISRGGNFEAIDIRFG